MQTVKLSVMTWKEQEVLINTVSLYLERSRVLHSYHMRMEAISRLLINFRKKLDNICLG